MIAQIKKEHEGRKPNGWDKKQIEREFEEITPFWEGLISKFEKRLFTVPEAELDFEKEAKLHEGEWIHFCWKWNKDKSKLLKLNKSHFDEYARNKEASETKVVSEKDPILKKILNWIRRPKK